MKRGGIAKNGKSVGAPARLPTNRPIRILVADDDVLLSSINALVLIRFGYQAETAEDGEAAWDALQAYDYDLLITDNNMPKVSGVELVRKIRSAQMTIPIILASGSVAAYEVDSNEWLQPVATIEKPFSSNQLLAKVNAALARSI